MPTTKAGQKAVNKYIAKTYDRVNLILKKSESPTKDEVQAAADAAGESLNGFIVGAITQRMKKHRCTNKCTKKAGRQAMPEISLFHGIRVTMFYSDHNPPHFHAEYAGNRALVDIQNACIIRGALPGRQVKLILAWRVLHQDELMQNWELAKENKPLNHIEPLM